MRDKQLGTADMMHQFTMTSSFIYYKNLRVASCIIAMSAEQCKMSKQEITAIAPLIKNALFPY